MALKRRYSRKSRRPTKTRRRFNISRPVRYTRPHGGSMMRVTKTWYAGNWSPNTTTVAGFWQYFTASLAQMPEVSMFSSVFESYRINWIKWTLRPRYTGFDGANTTDTTLPGVTNQGSCDLHVIIDPKSITTPSGTYSSTTLNSFLQSGRVRSYSGTKPINILVKYPCVLDDVNGVTQSKAVRSSYYDCSTTLAHRGAHLFISDVNLTGTFGQSFDIFTTMNVTFKGQK